MNCIILTFVPRSLVHGFVWNYVWVCKKWNLQFRDSHNFGPYKKLWMTRCSHFQVGRSASYPHTGALPRYQNGISYDFRFLMGCNGWKLNCVKSGCHMCETVWRNTGLCENVMKINNHGCKMVICVPINSIKFVTGFSHDSMHVGTNQNSSLFQVRLVSQWVH